MSDPGDGQRFLLTALMAIWLAAFLYAFVSFATSAPTGEGFVRGANRVMSYLGWQGIAGMIAIAVFPVGRRWPKGSAIRTMASVPLGIAVLHILAIVGVFLWARAPG